MMTSLCSEYWQFFLAQGLLMGVGMGFLTIPSMVTVQRHFTKHRGLATGFTIAGSSTGGIIWPIALDRLLNADGVSFGWTVRIIGFVMLLPLTLATLLVRPPVVEADAPKTSIGTPVASEDPTPNPEVRPATKKKLDFSVARDPTYVCFVIGVAIYNLAMFAPFFFLTSYAISIGMSTSLAFYLLSVLNGASLFGRIIMGAAADRFGPFNAICLVAILSAIIAFCWTTATSVGALVVWAIAYGFSSGVSYRLLMQTCHEFLLTASRSLGDIESPNAVRCTACHPSHIWHSDRTGHGSHVDFQSGWKPY